MNDKRTELAGVENAHPSCRTAHPLLLGTQILVLIVMSTQSPKVLVATVLGTVAMMALAEAGKSLRPARAAGARPLPTVGGARRPGWSRTAAALDLAYATAMLLGAVAVTADPWTEEDNAGLAHDIANGTFFVYPAVVTALLLLWRHAHVRALFPPKDDAAKAPTAPAGE